MILATLTCRTFSDSNCLPDDEIHLADLYFDFLKHNFHRHSSLSVGYRSPFIIELDLFWLSEQQDKRLEGLIRFIEYVLNSEEYRYVYFVSIEQAFEWLKYPRKLDQLEDFWAFSCSETIYDYDIDCSGAQSSLLKKEEMKGLVKENETNSSDSSSSSSRQAEDLFRSGIVFHSIWVFILLILTVLFYDKYFTNK